jgi:SEL1 protein
MPGGDDYYYDDIDADILETLTIVALAGVLAFLVYYRRLFQQNRHPQADEQGQNGAVDQGGDDGDDDAILPGQQQDGGFFPPPEDPNFDMWRAGGIGH